MGLRESKVCPSRLMYARVGTGSRISDWASRICQVL